MTVSLRSGTATEVFSYDSASLYGRGLSNAPTIGSRSISILLLGSSFGQSEATVNARIGFTASEATVWISDTSAVCKAGQGSGSTIRLAVTVGMRPGTHTQAWSYDSPSISSLGRPNIPSTGSVALTIFGGAFAHADISPWARVGFTSCEGTSWTSETSVKCLVASGVFATLRVLVTASVKAGTTTELMSYDTPRVSHVVNSNCPVLGGCNILILGSGFGHSDMSAAARIGRTACITTPWLSSSSLSCRVPYGSGARREVVATIGMRTMSKSLAFSYDAPVIFPETLRKYPSGDRSRFVTLDTTKGSEDVAFEGVNFGSFPSYLAVTYGHPHGWGSYICDINVELSSDSMVVCTVPAGIGKLHRFQIVVDAQNSVGTDFLSYPAPSLDSGAVKLVGSITPAGDVLLSTTNPGIDELEISGLHFGTNASFVSVSYGPTPAAAKYNCQVLSLTDHSTLRCRIVSYGSGVGHVLNVTVGRQSVISTDTINYPPPSMTSALPAVGNTTVGGVETVRITGENFGPEPSDVRVNLGSKFHCAVSSHGRLFNASSVLHCVVPSGTGTSHKISMTVSGQHLEGGVESSYSYPRPKLFDGTLKLLGAVCTNPLRCGSVEKGDFGVAMVTTRTTVGGVDVVELEGANFGPFSGNVSVDYGLCDYNRTPPVITYEDVTECDCRNETFENTTVFMGNTSGAEANLTYNSSGSNQTESNASAALSQSTVYYTRQVCNCTNRTVERVTPVVNETDPRTRECTAYEYRPIYSCKVLYPGGSAVNHSKIRCVLESGSGIDYVFRVRVDGQETFGRDRLAYADPVLTSVSFGLASQQAGTERFNASVPRTFVGSTTVGGADMLRIFGRNFGPIASRVHVTYGPPDDPGKYECVRQGIAEELNHTETVCLMSSGISYGYLFRFTLSNYSFTVPYHRLMNVGFDYPKPIVQGATLRYACNEPGENSTVLVEHILNSTDGVVLRVKTTVSNQTCMNRSTDVNATGRDGGDVLQLDGLNFGPLPDAVSVSYTRSFSPVYHPAVLTNFTTHTSMRIRTTPGFGHSLFFAVHVGNQTGLGTDLYHYPEGPRVRPNETAYIYSSVSSTALTMATVGKAHEITIQARDWFQQKAVGGGDSWSIISTEARTLPVTSTAVDNFDGTYRVSTVFTRSGFYVMSVFLMPKQEEISGSPFVIQVAPSNVALGRECTAVIGTETAGLVFSFRLETRDKWGNEFFGAPDLYYIDAVPFGATSASSISSRLIAPPAAVGPDRRLYVVGMSVTASANYTVRVFYNGSLSSESPYALQVIPGAASPTGSLLLNSTNAANVTADEVTVFRIRLRDDYGNNRTLASDFIAAAISSGPVLNKSAIIVDPGPGIYRVSLRLTRSGDYAIALGVPDLSRAFHFSPLRLMVRSGVPNALATIAQGQALSSGTAGVEAAASVRFFDQFSNPVVEEGIDASVRMLAVGTEATNATIEAAKDSAAVVYSGGAYTVRYTQEIKGDYALGVLVGRVHIFGSPFIVKILSGPVLASNCRAIQTTVPDVAEAWRSGFFSGQEEGLFGGRPALPLKVVILAMDAYGNFASEVSGISFLFSMYTDPSYPIPPIENIGGGALVGQFTPQFIVNGKYDLTCHIKYMGNHISGSPFVTSIWPAAGPPFPRNTYATGPAISMAKAGVSTDMTIQVADAFGLQLTLGGLSFEISMLLNGTTSAVVRWVDQGTGQYVTSVVATVAGTYSLQVMVLGSGAIPISGSPFSVQVIPASTSASKCIVLGQGLTLATAGVTGSFMIQARDSFGNDQRYYAGEASSDSLTASLDGPVAATAVVKDMEDGTYAVSYSTTTSGFYSVTVLLPDGDGTAEVGGSPFDLVALAADISPVTSLISGEQITTAIAGQRSGMYVTLRDEFGNPALATQQRITVVIQEDRPDSVAITIELSNSTLYSNATGNATANMTVNATLNMTDNATDGNLTNATFAAVLDEGVVCIEQCIRDCRNTTFNDTSNAASNTTENVSTSELDPGCYVVCDEDEPPPPSDLSGNHTLNFSGCGTIAGNFTGCGNFTGGDSTGNGTNFTGCGEFLGSITGCGNVSLSGNWTLSNLTGNTSLDSSAFFNSSYDGNSSSRFWNVSGNSTNSSGNMSAGNMSFQLPGSDVGVRICRIVCNGSSANNVTNTSSSSPEPLEICIAGCNATCNKSLEVNPPPEDDYGTIKLFAEGTDTVRVTYILTRSGPYRVSVIQNNSNITGSPLQITVLCTAPAAATSELLIAQKEWRVDRPLYATVSASDFFGNPGPECSFMTNDVSMELSGGGWAAPAAVTNNLDGTYTGEVTNLRLGDYTVHAELLGAVVEPPVNQTSDVAVIPGAMAASSSGPEAFGLVKVTAGTPAEILVTVRDSQDNPTWYRDASSVLQADVTPYVINGTNATITDLNSTIAVSYNATLAGTYSMSVTLDGLHLSGSPYSINVQSSAVDAASALASGSGLTIATAGVVSRMFVVMRDVYGNRVGSDPFRQDPVVAYSILENQEHFVNATDENGTATQTGNWTMVEVVASHGGISGFDGERFTMSYSVTRSGSYTLGVTVGSLPIVQGASLLVHPSIAVASRSFFAINTSLVYAGDAFDILVTLRDTYSNTLTNVTSLLGASLIDARFIPSTPPSPNRQMAFTCETISHDADSGATLILRCSCFVAGNASAEVYLTSTSASIATSQQQPPHISVLPLATASASASTVQGSGLAGGATGSTLTVRMSVRDEYGNRVSQGDPGMSINYDDGTSSVDIIGTRVQVGGFVEYEANYTAVREGYGVVRIYLAGAVAAGSPYFVATDANVSGSVDPSKTFAHGDGLVSATAGSSARFLIQAVNEKGQRFTSNAAILPLFDAFISRPGSANTSISVVNGTESSGSFTAGYLLTKTGRYSLHVSYAGAHISGSPFSLDVLPSDARLTSTLVFGTQLTLATAGVSASFKVQARDAYLNPVLPSAYFSSSFRPLGVQVMIGSQFADLVPPNDEALSLNSTIVASFTPSVSGTYQVSVTLLGGKAPSSPSSLVVAPGPLAPVFSSAVGLGLSASPAGVSSEFRLTAVDALGTTKPLSQSDPNLVLLFPTSNATSFSAEPVEGGSLVVSYSMTASGTYPLHVSLAGVHFSGSPFSVSVTAGAANAKRCTAEGLGLLGATAGKPGTFVITSRDTYGNTLSRGGFTFTTSLLEPTPLNRYLGKCIDKGDGSYDCSYTSIVMGSLTVSIMGGLESISGSPFKVTVLKAGFNSSQSKVLGGSGPRSGIAGQQQEVTIVGYDAFRNRITTGWEVFSVALQGPVSFTVPIDDFVDYLDGTYKAVYTPTVAGQYSLSVKYQDVHVTPSPFSLSVSPSEASADNSSTLWPTLVACGPSRLCGSVTMNVTAQMRPIDAYGNLREGVHPVQAIVTPNGSVAYQGGVPELGIDGMTQVTFVATVAGSYTVSLLLAGRHLKGSPFELSMAAQLFSSGGGFRAMGDGVTIATSGVKSSFRIESRDIYGNFVPQGISPGSFRFSAIVAANGSAAGVSSNVHADPLGGSWTANVSVNTSGLHYLTVSALGINSINSPHPYTVVSRPVALANCEAYGPARFGVFTGRIARLFVQIRDDMMNPVPIARGDIIQVIVTFEVGGRVLTPPPQPVAGSEGLIVVEYEPSVYEIGLAICEVKINGKHLYYINPIKPGFYVRVFTQITDSLEPSLSIALGDALTSATAGVASFFKIQAVDTNGYYFNTGGSAFRAEMSLLEVYVPVASIDNNDGTYTIPYMLTVSGTYNMELTSDGVPIKGSPFRLFVKPAQTDVARCNVAGAGLTVSTAGSTVSFRIQARDRFSNLQSYTPGAPIPIEFAVSLQGPAPTPAQVTYLVGSSFLATFSVTTSGSYTALVSANGGPTRSYPLRVNPSLAYGPASSLGRGAQSSVVAGVVTRIPLDVRDIYGNSVSIANDGVPWPVVIALADPGPISLPVLSSGTSFIALLNVSTVGGRMLRLSARGVAFASGAPYPFTVVHAQLSSEMSTGRGPGIAGGRADSDMQVVLTARDTYGNPYLDISPSDVSLSIAPSSLEMTFTVSSVLQGVASVSYTVWKPCSVSSSSSSSSSLSRTCLLSAKLKSLHVSGSPFGVLIEPADPPRMVEARLDYGLTSMQIKFDIATDRGGLTGIFPCGDVIDSSSIAAVGSDSACTWITYTALRVVLGTSPSLQPLDPVSIKPGTIMTYRRNSLKASGSQPIQLPPSYAPPVPIIVGPSSIGPCDSLTLDASSSPGGGGRPLAFTWGLVIGSPGRDAIMSTLVALPASTSTLKLSNASLEVGSFEFIVTTRNFLGQSSTATFKVKKSTYPMPAVSIYGPGTARRSDRISLRASVQAPANGCNGIPLTSDSFLWSQDQGPKLLAWPEWELTRASPTLVIPPRVLSAGQTYAFSVSVAGVRAAAVKSVEVVSSGLIAAVIGGNNRTASPNTALVFDASPSLDPDEDTSPMSYTWSCVGPGGAECFRDTSGILLANTPKMTLPAGTLLPLQEYIVTVTVSKDPGPRRSTVSIDVVTTAVPTSGVGIQINGGVSRKVSTDKRLVLLGNITRSDGVSPCSNGVRTFLWSIAGGDADLGRRSTPLTASNLVLLPGTLVSGQEFAIQLRAACPGESEGRARIRIVANSPPTGGATSVSPTSGQSLATLFRVQTSQWADDAEDLPLSYLFAVGTSSSSSVSPTPLSSSIPQNVIRVVLANRGAATAAASNAISNQTALYTNQTLFVSACDVHGACSDLLASSATVVLRSSAETPSQAQLAVDFEAVSSTASAIGDVDLVLQACFGAGSLISASAAAALEGGGGSRRIGSESAALRQSIMASLSSASARSFLDEATIAFIAASLQPALSNYGQLPLEAFHSTAMAVITRLASTAAEGGLAGLTQVASDNLALAISDASLSAGATQPGQAREGYYAQLDAVLVDMGRASLLGRVPYEVSQDLDATYFRLTVQRLGQDQVEGRTPITGRCAGAGGVAGSSGALCHTAVISSEMMPRGGYAIDVQLVNWGTLRHNGTSGDLLLTNGTGVRVIGDDSASIEAPRLQRPNMLTFPLANDTLNVDVIPRCTYWRESLSASEASEGKGEWSGVGCIAVNAENDTITCACYHLSEFIVPATPTLANIQAGVVLQDFDDQLQFKAESALPFLILAMLAGGAIVLALACSCIPKPRLLKLGPLIDLARLSALELKDGEDKERQHQAGSAGGKAGHEILKLHHDGRHDRSLHGEKEVVWADELRAKSPSGRPKHDKPGTAEIVEAAQGARMRGWRMWPRAKRALFWELWRYAFTHMMRQRHIVIGIFFAAANDPMPPAARALILSVHAASALAINMLLLGAAGFTNDMWMSSGAITGLLLMPICSLWALLFRQFFGAKTSKGPLGGLVVPSRVHPVREEAVVEIEVAEEEEEETPKRRRRHSTRRSSRAGGGESGAESGAESAGEAHSPTTRGSNTHMSVDGAGRSGKPPAPPGRSNRPNIPPAPSPHGKQHGKPTTSASAGAGDAAADQATSVGWNGAGAGDGSSSKQIRRPVGGIRGVPRPSTKRPENVAPRPTPAGAAMAAATSPQQAKTSARVGGGGGGGGGGQRVSGAGFGFPLVGGSFALPQITVDGHEQEADAAGAGAASSSITVSGGDFGFGRRGEALLERSTPLPLLEGEILAKKQERPEPVTRMPWALAIPLYLSALVSIVLSLLVAMAYGRIFGESTSAAWILASFTSLLLEYVVFQTIIIALQAGKHVRDVMLLAAGQFEWNQAASLEWDCGASDEASASEPYTVAPTPQLEFRDEELLEQDLAMLSHLRRTLVVERWLEAVASLHEISLSNGGHLELAHLMELLRPWVPDRAEEWSEAMWRQLRPGAETDKGVKLLHVLELIAPNEFEHHIVHLFFNLELSEAGEAYQNDIRGLLRGLFFDRQVATIVPDKDPGSRLTFDQLRVNILRVLEMSQELVRRNAILASMASMQDAFVADRDDAAGEGVGAAEDGAQVAAPAHMQLTTMTASMAAAPPPGDAVPHHMQLATMQTSMTAASLTDAVLGVRELEDDRGDAAAAGGHGHGDQEQSAGEEEVDPLSPEERKMVNRLEAAVVRMFVVKKRKAEAGTRGFNAVDHRSEGLANFGYRKHHHSRKGRSSKGVSRRSSSKGRGDSGGSSPRSAKSIERYLGQKSPR